MGFIIGLCIAAMVVSCTAKSIRDEWREPPCSKQTEKK